jgi:uncharacterized membrane protein YgcG
VASARPAARIDEAWLADNVLALPAEVVGAVWDRSIGAAEVAATLARLEAEGKIETWPDETDSSVRHLRLRVAPTALRGHERLLLDALLVDGGTETDTRAVSRHYASVGFDPTTVIQEPLEKEVRALLGHDRRPPAPLRWTTAVLVLAAVAAIASALIAEGDPMPLFAGIALLPVYLVGVFLAFAWRSRVGSRRLAAAVLAPVALLAAGVVLAQAWGAGTDPLALGAVAVLAVAFANSVLNVARTRETAAAMRVRKRLTAAERFLRRELRGGSAAVRPEWFPHLLALGLADDANRWSAARPTPDGVAVTSWRGDGDGDRAAASSSRSEPFTAGGGRFGGAGASGSWGAAAHAFSASIAAPSSSSSDGGSSSGSSSSSGGGGGGGW